MDESKKITISGTNNKYAIKNLINNRKENEIKKRVVSQKWNFNIECFETANQLCVLKNIDNNIDDIHSLNDELTKVIIQEIYKKISGYKQQDLLKKHYNVEKFITFDNVIKKLIESNLKCRYCDCDMLVLYDISRELKQWSIDRIDNDEGHNNDNFHLACFDCNIKRRRRSDEKFLFTKKLNLIKQDY